MKQDTNEQWRRWRTLHELEAWLETPMIVLSFVWVGAVLAELIWGGSVFLETVSIAVWVVFLAEFALKLSLAPKKLGFIRHNWLTVIALVVPAVRVFRVLRVFRFARAVRGIRLIRIVGGMNRGMNALRRSMARQGFGYVMLLSLLVVLLGAAGMLAFENDREIAGGFHSYAHALWWTAMILTTMGSDFWPQTLEGRVLCLFLALYAFAVFGYVTAILATFFLGKEEKRSDVAALTHEIARLRRQLETRAPAG